MKTVRLAVAFLASALLGSVSRAQSADAVLQARESLKRLEDSVGRVVRGDYLRKDRRAVLRELELLQPRVEALKPPQEESSSPRSENWRRLNKAAEEALKGEKDFWAEREPGADEDQPLPASTARPLKERSAEVSSAFSALFPERTRAPGALAGGQRGADAPERLPTQAAQVVARGAARGSAATSHPDQFFDGGGLRAGQASVWTAGGAAASAHARPRPAAAGSGPARTEADSLSETPTSLRVASVPGLAPAEVPASQPAWTRSRAALRAAGATAPDVLRDAVRSTPVLTGAAGALPARADAARPAPAAEPRAAGAPEAATGACLQATAAHSTVSGLCRNHPTLAPLLAGLLEALQEQFGTVQGLVINLAYLLLGLVMSALTGFGVIAKIVVGLVSLGMLAYTFIPMLQQGYEAVKQLTSTGAGDVRHSEALLSIGKLGGTVLIMALMAAIGYGIGKTQTGRAAMSATTEAISSKLADVGLKSGMAALDAKIPPSVRSFLGGPVPAEDASLSDFGGSASSIPRSVKSTMLFSEETLRRNAAISEREIRIGAAMKQLGVDRAFAEKVADAHEQVPCAVGKCTREELRRKMEILGRGSQSAAAIRSGLAGSLPADAAALDGTPGSAAFVDETGRYSPSGAAPAAAPAARFDVPAGKWDYFFGRVKAKPSEGLPPAELTRQTHNVERSAQIARVLNDNGIQDDPAGRELLMKVFREASSARAIREIKNDYGATLVKPAELPGATLEVSFFYAKDAAGRVDLSGPAVVTTIIPKEH